jgi:pre-mRNA-processing factor 17
LTASASGKVKIFDVYHDRELLRTYSGHTKSCNDIDFNPTDGVEFLTSSLDRKMKLWDTETGQCKSSFATATKATPHVIRFIPSSPHEFLAGMADKKIVQFDIRSGEQVQVYDNHLGPINTLTHTTNGCFITSSDDRSLIPWMLNIPVPIKTIAEADMFSMTRSAHHPSKAFIAFQSSDNQIAVYSSSDRFRRNKKKSFRGHNTTGYAIDVAFSGGEGDFLISGDTGGYLCIWSWKTCKLMHKIQASDSPVLSCQWHPREPSKVVTGDQKGIIKYWS